MSAPRVDIHQGDPRAPDASALLAASHRLMEASFPAESNHFLSIEALCRPDILFLVADVDGIAAGCAALAICSEEGSGGYGEVKSMFVSPARRGARIGAKLLNRLEAEARARGLPLLRLETGDTLIAAQKLYLQHGFRIRGPFGAYREDPRSLFMEKNL